MSNALTGNVWKVDTASATPIFTSWQGIRKLEWIAATTAGHTCTVKDQNGNILFTRQSQGANQNWVETYPERFGKQFDGLAVVTLDSGVLYIHFSKEE